MNDQLRTAKQHSDSQGTKINQPCHNPQIKGKETSSQLIAGKDSPGPPFFCALHCRPHLQGLSSTRWCHGTSKDTARPQWHPTKKNLTNKLSPRYFGATISSQVPPNILPFPPISRYTMPLKNSAFQTPHVAAGQ